MIRLRLVMLFGITRCLAESRPKGKDYMMLNRGVIMIAGPFKRHLETISGIGEV